jgi:four helix bundle protein
MKENPVLEKSFAFALRIIKLNRYLIEEKKELLVSGTHIGKHIKEAVGSESKTVFTNEMGKARRVASETEYWLQLLLQADYISEKAFDSIETDRLEIFKMLTSIVKTSKENE